MSLKSRVEGRVTEVGWEPGTPKSLRVYALIKVKLSSPRRQDTAEKQLKRLQKKILNKKIVIFPEE